MVAIATVTISTGAVATAGADEAPPVHEPIPVYQIPASTIGFSSFFPGPVLSTVTATPTGALGEVTFAAPADEGACATTFHAADVVIDYHNAETKETGTVAVNPCANSDVVSGDSPASQTVRTDPGLVTLKVSIANAHSELDAVWPRLPGSGFVTVDG